MPSFQNFALQKSSVSFHIEAKLLNLKRGQSEYYMAEEMRTRKTEQKKERSKCAGSFVKTIIKRFIILVAKILKKFSNPTLFSNFNCQYKKILNYICFTQRQMLKPKLEINVAGFPFSCYLRGYTRNGSSDMFHDILIMRQHKLGSSFFKVILVLNNYA